VSALEAVIGPGSKEQWGAEIMETALLLRHAADNTLNSQVPFDVRNHLACKHGLKHSIPFHSIPFHSIT
jgi:hypothetical protein